MSKASSSPVAGPAPVAQKPERLVEGDGLHVGRARIEVDVNASG